MIETPAFLIQEGIQTKACTYLHLLTFPEVVGSKIPVCDIQGRMWAGPDRKLTTHADIIEVWKAWRNNYKIVFSGDYEVFKAIPQKVNDYFQAVKDIVLPSDRMLRDLEPLLYKVVVPIIKEVVIEPVKSIPKFTWSYTALNDFETCPMKFAAARYYKTTKFEDTEATIWGKRKHKANELALKEVMKGLEEDLVDWKYVNLLREAAKGGELLVESQIAINRKLQVVDWFAQDAWGRGVIDVAIIKNGVAKIFDWKTGREKIDDTQLKVFCILLALKYKEVQEFESRFIWLKTGGISDPMRLKRADLLNELKELLARIERMEQAWNNEIFQARTSGLCKNYCSVIECAHCGKR